MSQNHELLMVFLDRVTIDNRVQQSTIVMTSPKHTKFLLQHETTQKGTLSPPYKFMINKSFTMDRRGHNL